MSRHILRKPGRIVFAPGRERRERLRRVLLRLSIDTGAETGYSGRRKNGGEATDTANTGPIVKAWAGRTLSATSLLTLRRREPESALVFASWAALEPEEGRLDEDALAGLRDRLLRIGGLGIEPVLCLYRGEDPDWFLRRGGWAKEDNLRCFLRYTGRLVRSVGHLCGEYITFYEPNEMVWREKKSDLRRNYLTLSHIACVHVRAYRLIRDTRVQRGLEDTAVGVALRMMTPARMRRELLMGRARTVLSAYQKLPLLAMAKGEFRLPLRNTLRIRPGTWCDFVALLCDEPDRERCRNEAASIGGVPVRDILEIEG